MVSAAVLVIAVDGLSSDLLAKNFASAPNMAKLRATGAYTMTSRINPRPNSQQSWGTHLYGHGPAAHGWYRSAPAPRGCTGLPSLFDVVPSSYAVSSDWPAFAHAMPQVQNKASDRATADAAQAALSLRKYELVFARFGQIDEYAHTTRLNARAFSTEDAGLVTRLHNVDALVGQLVTAVTSNDYVLLISDHGLRSCRWWELTCGVHFGARLTEVNTPMLAKGPGVKPGQLRRRITHQDTSYTVLRWLNHSVPCEWQLGQVDSNCTGTWPGTQSNVQTHEEDYAHLADILAWVLIVLAVIAAVTAMVLSCCNPCPRNPYAHPL